MITVETAVIGAPCGRSDVGVVERDPVMSEVTLLVTNPAGEFAVALVGELGAEFSTVVPCPCVSDEGEDKAPEGPLDVGAGADAGGELDGFDVGVEGELAGGEGFGVEGGGVGDCAGGGVAGDCAGGGEDGDDGGGDGGGFEWEDDVGEGVGDGGGGGGLDAEADDEEELSVEGGLAF